MAVREGPWLYGINPVIERLRSGCAVQRIYILRSRSGSVIRRILEYAKARGVPVERVDRSFFSSFPSGHQGVAARVAGPEKTYSVEDLYDLSAEKGEPPFYLLLTGITDPHNLGAIIRTAEVAGVHGVIMEKRRVASGMTVAKTSAGAIEHIPIVRVSNIKHAIMGMKERGITVYAAEADGEILHWDADLRAAVAILLGSEGEGIRPTVKKYCDRTIRIPVRGKVNSLNVSVAAGVLLYEALRQRMKA